MIYRTTKFVQRLPFLLSVISRNIMKSAIVLFVPICDVVWVDIVRAQFFLAQDLWLVEEGGSNFG